MLAGGYANVGTIGVGAGTTINVTGTADSKLINAGTVMVSGITYIGPTITDAGTMTVGDPSGNSGSWKFGGKLSTGQAPNLKAGTLTDDNAKDLLAIMFDFNPHDQIVLEGGMLPAWPIKRRPAVGRRR